MITIKLTDARRGLYLKCRELFGDERIAENIYNYLCDGIEECEECNPERRKGKWICISDGLFEIVKCDQCGQTLDSKNNFCPNCGADNRG